MNGTYKQAMPSKESMVRLKAFLKRIYWALRDKSWSEATLGIKADEDVNER